MAVFATEAGVRLQVQVEDTSVASAELVTACIVEAHERVLADLDGGVDLESPPEAVVQGETLLAAGGVLRGLASRDAAEQVELQIGGQRVGAGQRFASLMSMARRFEKAGYVLLAPHSAQPEADCPARVGETTEVLGE